MKTLLFILSLGLFSFLISTNLFAKTLLDCEVENSCQYGEIHQLGYCLEDIRVLSYNDEDFIYLTLERVNNTIYEKYYTPINLKASIIGNGYAGSSSTFKAEFAVTKKSTKRYTGILKIKNYSFNLSCRKTY